MLSTTNSRLSGVDKSYQLYAATRSFFRLLPERTSYTTSFTIDHSLKMLGCQFTGAVLKFCNTKMLNGYSHRLCPILAVGLILCLEFTIESEKAKATMSPKAEPSLIRDIRTPLVRVLDASANCIFRSTRWMCR